MKAKQIATIKSGQDGAAWGGFLFRFNTKGHASVYDMNTLSGKTEPIAEFTLDGTDIVIPHANAVVFGNEYYAEGDEFPLLYNNVYNNYKNAEDRLVGVCCVYRIVREGNKFSSALVQLIEIGFADEVGLWLSDVDVKDVRPYGNFVIDRDKGIYYGFVMRDGDRTTRYFAFKLPRPEAGDPDPRLGVRLVKLGRNDILRCFDTPYHSYIQGACCHEGKIYSVEGFGESIHPALRIIDTVTGEQVFYRDLYQEGLVNEAELIDCYGGKCYYGDAHGSLFELDLQD